MKQTNNPTPQPDEWEKKFDELFEAETYLPGEGAFSSVSIKDFIHQLLKTQRQKLIKEMVVWIGKNRRRIPNRSENYSIIGAAVNLGYNQALDDLVKYLKKEAKK